MTRPIELVKTTSNGRNLPKGPLERLQHRWEFDDNLIRKSWHKKKYRLSYQQVVNLWNKYLEPCGWKWSHIEFCKFFIRRYPIWPNTTTSKWFPIKKGSRVWHTLKDHTWVWEDKSLEGLAVDPSYMARQMGRPHISILHT